MKFWGYRRANGSIGVRNHVLVFPTVICASTVAQMISREVPGAVCVTHPHGCGHLGEEKEHMIRVMSGFCGNPNVAGVLLVGLGLEDRLSTTVGTLSGGQRQALALVMATISKPAILLLDEHVATLDPKTAQTVLELTDMIVLRGKMTTIMVTHNMEIALRYGNRLIMMHNGRIVVDMGEADKKTLAISDLVTAFERAAGEEFKDDTILLTHD